MKTQGARLAALLTNRPHTYAEMNRLGISVCPHKRLVEWEERHPEWAIVRGRRLVWVDGETVFLTTWAVKRVRTA